MSLASQSIASVVGAENAGKAQHVRQLIRQGTWHSHTSGLASDHVQGNVVILPENLATDFLRYCQRNPKPCPLLADSEPGQVTLPTLGDDIDIFSDSLPRPGQGTTRCDELPSFLWACAITTQAAIAQARPEFCNTHAPRAMLITHLLNQQLVSV